MVAKALRGDAVGEFGYAESGDPSHTAVRMRTPTTHPLATAREVTPQAIGRGPSLSENIRGTTAARETGAKPLGLRYGDVPIASTHP